MSAIFSSLVIFLAFTSPVFLFWRTCRHELIESNKAFDITIIGLLGATVGARIFEFAANFEKFSWSFSRFIFFNKYFGFDFYGAILGALVATYLFLRQRKVKILQIFDLAAAPVAFGQTLFNLGQFLRFGQDHRGAVFLYYTLGYFIIFLILTRLSTRTRHYGFFVGLYIILISFVDLVLFRFRTSDLLILGKIPYHVMVPGVYLIVGAVFWYITSKRNFKKDLKSLFAQVLLSVFRARRVITNIDEAGKLSRSVVLVPLFLVKLVLVIVKLILREVRLGFLDLLYVLGLKHDRY